MKRLIINSDDYGRTPEISRGIREAHLHGVVTSATCMMNIATTASDIALAVQETPRLGLGVHLVLTMGRPILPRAAVQSFTDEHGNLLGYDSFIKNLPRLDLNEVKAEWRAQIEAFIRAAGRRPTHLDSHHHASYFSPALFRGMLELSKEYGCAIRYPLAEKSPPELTETARQASLLVREFNPRRPDVFLAEFYDEGATRENLLNILASLKNGAAELMCHPGHVDGAFAKESAYNFQRERELKILCDPAIQHTIQANRIELITFANL